MRTKEPLAGRELWEAERVAPLFSHVGSEGNDGEELKYKDSYRVLCHVCTGFILELHDQNSIQMLIVRNFLAKGVMFVRSIFQLWESTAIQECQVLYRCLVDRLFYLRKLISENSFQAFEDWSFAEQYDFHAELRADPRYKHQTDLLPPIPNSDRERRKSLKNRLTWKKPEAKDMANDISRDYLYRYGFVYGSMHIHPYANDGQRDYETVTGLRSGTDWPSETYVLRNSVLVLWLMLSDTLHDLQIPISGYFRNFIEGFFDSLENNDQRYWGLYYELVESFKRNEPWFEIRK